MISQASPLFYVRCFTILSFGVLQNPLSVALEQGSHIHQEQDMNLNILQSSRDVLQLRSRKGRESLERRETTSGCYEAYTPDYSSCTDYTACGYTCVADHCAYDGSLGCLCECENYFYEKCSNYFPDRYFVASSATCEPTLPEVNFRCTFDANTCGFVNTGNYSWTRLWGETLSVRLLTRFRYH